MNFCLRQDEAVEGINDCESGEDSSGPNQVVGPGVIFLAKAQEFLNVGDPVILAAGRFRWGLAEVGVTGKFVEKLREVMALSGQLGVFVVAQAAFGVGGAEGFDGVRGGGGGGGEYAC